MRTGTVHISEEISGEAGTARGTSLHLILLQNSAGSFLSFQSCPVMSEALTHFSQSQKYPRMQNTIITVSHYLTFYMVLFGDESKTWL